MLNNCFTQNKNPTIWRKSKIIAILKPGKDSAISKSYRPISLLCHTYKLYKQLILNRIVPTIDDHTIKEQAGVPPGKFFESNMYELTVESDSTQRRWLPGRKYHGNRFCGTIISVRHSVELHLIRLPISYYLTARGTKIANPEESECQDTLPQSQHSHHHSSKKNY